MAQAEALLDWFAAARRDLPWRAPAGQLADPYAVWVSEVMLQQTRVEVVRAYYERWMKELPTLKHLALADEAQILSLWQGLGYYSRARRLREGALFLLRDGAGVVPPTVTELLAVPGIGPYSAGAIASIAFGKREPLVDGNVVRVLCRFYGLPGDPNKAPLKRRLWQLARELVPVLDPGDFNQALMELGATLCKPRRPDCSSCPWAGGCQARALGQTETLPELPKKPAATSVRMVVVLYAVRGRFLVEQQPTDARWWARLWAFPHFEVTRGQEIDDAVSAWLSARGLGAGTRTNLAAVSHTVTRFRIRLHPVALAGASERGRPQHRAPSDDAGQLAAQFATPEALMALPMPAPHHKLALSLTGRQGLSRRQELPLMRDRR